MKVGALWTAYGSQEPVGSDGFPPGMLVTRAPMRRNGDRRSGAWTGATVPCETGRRRSRGLLGSCTRDAQRMHNRCTTASSVCIRCASLVHLLRMALAGPWQGSERACSQGRALGAHLPSSPSAAKSQDGYSRLGKQSGQAGRLTYFSGGDASGGAEKDSTTALATVGMISRSLAWSTVKVTRTNFAPLGSST